MRVRRLSQQLRRDHDDLPDADFAEAFDPPYGGRQTALNQHNPTESAARSTLAGTLTAERLAQRWRTPTSFVLTFLPGRTAESRLTQDERDELAGIDAIIEQANRPFDDGVHYYAPGPIAEPLTIIRNAVSLALFAFVVALLLGYDPLGIRESAPPEIEAWVLWVMGRSR